VKPGNGKIGDSPLRIAGVKLLSGTQQKSANNVYKDWTYGEQPIAQMAFWVKPAGSIRIYAHGKWLGQIMQLRDTGGWAVRDVEVLTDFVANLVARIWKTENGSHSRPWIAKVVERALALSERRRGGAVYVMNRDVCDRLISREPTHKVSHPHGRIERMSETELSCYLEQDGAVVVDPSGNLIALGSYFRAAGGRKKTAEDLAQSEEKFPLLAIVVSQDGPVYLYSGWLEDNERDAPAANETRKKPVELNRFAGNFRGAFCESWIS